MRSALSASTIVCFLASASLATAQDLMPVPFTHVGLREAGVVAVQRMSSDPLQRQAFTAVQLQPTKLKADRKTEADEVVCLEVPEMLYAIDDHFRDFSQVSDDEVVEVLKARSSNSQPSGSGFQP